MKKKARSKASSVPRVDPYLDGLMAKLVERLIRLESKMDKVLSQTAGGGRAVPEVKEPPRREKMLYEAICADCHKVCEVPFKPSENRAVYCKECFAKRKAGRSGNQMPLLTPVALPPKPVGKLHMAAPVPPAPPAKAPKAKKSKPAKKTKKRK